MVVQSSSMEIPWWYMVINGEPMVPWTVYGSPWTVHGGPWWFMMVHGGPWTVHVGSMCWRMAGEVHTYLADVQSLHTSLLSIVLWTSDKCNMW